MELFDNYKALKRKDIIYIFKDNQIRFTYYIKKGYWLYERERIFEKHLEKYEDVEEHILLNAMKGRFPEKIKDFLDLFGLETLSFNDFLLLLHEDYPEYIDDKDIVDVIEFLLFNNEKNIDQIYTLIKTVFHKSRVVCANKESIIYQIKWYAFKVFGVDYFNRETLIADYFYDGWPTAYQFIFSPCRMIELFNDTKKEKHVYTSHSLYFIVKEKALLISLFKKYFDSKLNEKVGMCRMPFNGNHYTDAYDDVIRKIPDYKPKFEYYDTENLYTFETMYKIIKAIKRIIKDLKNNKASKGAKEALENIKKLYDTYDWYIAKPKYDQPLTKVPDSDVEKAIDIYQRFILKLEYTMKLASLDGYDLMCVSS